MLSAADLVAGEVAASAAAGPMSSDALVDARSLSFSQIDPRIGHLKPLARVSGRAVESRIPWSDLGVAAPVPGREFRALVRITGAEGATLQAPLAAREEDRASWMTWSISP